MSITGSRLVETGVAGLDEVLNGGLPADRIYLIEGDPGVGKTTLAMQFLLKGASLGEPVLYVTLSESEAELRAVAASHGWSLDGVTIYAMSTGEPGEGAVEEENTLYVPAEVELGERVKALLEVVDRIHPRRLVIDSCSELRLLAQTPLRFRRQVLALKHDLVARHCTILLLENPTSAGGDVLLQSLVHGVIRMEQLAPVYGAERRRLHVRKLREVRFRGGFHDCLIQPEGIVVFPRLVAAEHRAEYTAELLSSGVAALDALLGGGLDRGTSTLITGPAGTGKSALATRYVVSAAARGERSAVFAFDEGLATMLLRSKALGMDLRPYVDSGCVTIQQVDPAEMAPGEFVHAVRRAVEVDGARIVVIDSLNGYLNAMPEEQFVVIQLHELLTYLRQRGVVTMLVTAQHGLVGSNMTSPVDVSYLADTVVLLRYFETAGRVRKAVSVLKKRCGHHEDSIREIAVGRDGVTVGPPLEAFRGVLTGVPEFQDGAEPRKLLMDRPHG